MDSTINVLDHGFVRIVGHMGNDLSIVRNARVSYDAEWRAGKNKGSDERLIKYLYKNKHNTPFEAVVFTFDVRLPIFVTRQWQRHRTQSYSELSARYRELPELFYLPEEHLIGVQNKDNKQMRDTLNPDEYSKQPKAVKILNKDIIELMQEQNKEAFHTYKEIISEGVPRELARSILPVATYTHMFTTLNLHNLFGFLRERLHPHAQYEIRVYAQAMLKLIEPIVPVAVQAFKENLGEEYKC